MDELNKNNQEPYNNIDKKENNRIFSTDNINSNNELEESKDSNEKTPLKKNKRLINILKDMTMKLEKNEGKDIEEIYENYDGDDDYKIVIKEDCIKSSIILWYIFIGGLFVTINLVSVFTIRSVMNSLFEIFKFSLKCFLYKQSDLEKYNLTDFTNRFNFSYNNYGQFFNDIYNNNVDFDLMMFWDFIGFFMCKYCGFKCTYIFFFVIKFCTSCAHRRIRFLRYR